LTGNNKLVIAINNYKTFPVGNLTATWSKGRPLISKKISVLEAFEPKLNYSVYCFPGLPTLGSRDDSPLHSIFTIFTGDIDMAIIEKNLGRLSMSRTAEKAKSSKNEVGGRHRIIM
jgi:hypothetical protein